MMTVVPKCMRCYTLTRTLRSVEWWVSNELLFLDSFQSWYFALFRHRFPHELHVCLSSHLIFVLMGVLCCHLSLFAARTTAGFFIAADCCSTWVKLTMSISGNVLPRPRPEDPMLSPCSAERVWAYFQHVIAHAACKSGHRLRRHSSKVVNGAPVLAGASEVVHSCSSSFIGSAACSPAGDIPGRPQSNVGTSAASRTSGKRVASALLATKSEMQMHRRSLPTNFTQLNVLTRILHEARACSDILPVSVCW